MVSVEEIPDENPALTASQERLLDAEEIEKAAASMKRPTARMQLEALAKRIRKESEALKRVEMSHQQNENNNNNNNDEKKEDTAQQHAAASLPSTTSPTAATSKPSAPPAVIPSAKYVPIDRFAFDAGGYNAPFVTLYIDLPRVGSIPRDNITCNFTPDSFDLIVKDLEEKSYRLYKDSLEKDIDPEKSKTIVKADKVIVKLAKVKQSDYGGYDYWTKLTDAKKKDKGKRKDDPQSSIMDLMKQMYEEGDDNMKKVIGETMLKQQRGELGKDKSDPMAGLDDMNM